MNLGEVLLSWRKTKGIGTRQAAEIIGLSTATYNRVERGEVCDIKTLRILLLWLLAD